MGVTPEMKWALGALGTLALLIISAATYIAAKSYTLGRHAAKVDGLFETLH